MANRPGIEYSLREAFESDKYVANTVSRRIVKLEEFTQKVASKVGGLSEFDVVTVIKQMEKELIDILAKGESVRLDNFLSIRASISGNFDSLNSKFDPKKNKVRITVTPSSKMAKQLNRTPRVFKVRMTENLPELKKVYDLESGSYNSRLTVGGMFRLEGNRLFFNIKAEDEGIYIYSADRKRAIKVDYKDVVSNKELRFIVPPEIEALGDKVIIEIKSRMKTKTMRTGTSEYMLTVVSEE